jgi:DNA-directed RNA polymerase subunit alpha
MKLKPFVMPEKFEIEADTATDSYAKFIIAPLERGWGVTVGNALRRALLSRFKERRWLRFVSTV